MRPNGSPASAVVRTTPMSARIIPTSGVLPNDVLVRYNRRIPMEIDVSELGFA